MAEDMAIPLTPRSMSPVEDGEDSDLELNYDAPAPAAPEDAFFKNFQGSRVTKAIHELGVALNSRRKAAPQTINGANTAWIDYDDSGNYDPKAEHGRQPTKRNKRARTIGTSNRDDAQKPRNAKRRGRHPRTLVFSFTNEKALDYLRSITPDPEGSGESSSDEPLVSLDSDDDSGTGSRRTRRKIKQPNRLGVIEERFVEF